MRPRLDLADHPDQVALRDEQELADRGLDGRQLGPAVLLAKDVELDATIAARRSANVLHAISAGARLARQELSSPGPRRSRPPSTRTSDLGQLVKNREGMANDCVSG